MQRCEWATGSDLMIAYHDEEWGVPVHDDRTLFEFLILEGAQAGLNWKTILNKRAAYRRAFDDFDPQVVAAYDERKVASLLADPGIVRNRLKIAATVGNARALLQVQAEFGSFNAYLWRWVEGGAPRQNIWQSLSELPTRTPESDALSRDLLRRGFKFVGSTICYAYMQAVGLVNDHVTSCFRYDQLRAEESRGAGEQNGRGAEEGSFTPER
jgi:DNA-3-methyladenine glycosylase I